MVSVKIISGPRAGQENLVRMRPEELIEIAWHGWRWEVDWHTVSDGEAFEWGQYDLIAKVFSALIRGGEVRFRDQVWRVTATEGVFGVVQQVEDYVSKAGFNVMVGDDTEEYFVIIAHSPEQR